ncbi:MAG: hypothetical protein Cons2KO_15670 [Congregibacter sp.]
MTEKGSQKETPVDAPSNAAAIGMAGVERAFLRLTFWQTLLSLAGVFVGGVALYAALTESQAVREQTAAAVWPYVQMMMIDTATDERASFALKFSTVGVGPARIRGARLVVDGRVYRSWQEVADDAFPQGSGQLGDVWGKTTLTGRVLAPGEEITALSTDQRDFALAMQKAIYSGVTSFSFCFCSIFDQCWIQDSQRTALKDKVAAVEECPDFGDEAFLD